MLGTRKKWIWTLAATWLGAAGIAAAAGLAWDHAGEAAYSDGWQTGDAGGSGWGGAWSLNTSVVPPDGNVAGHFVGTSQNNGDGNGNVDVSGSSWGLYANSGYMSYATRPFAGTLGIGQSVILDMDNGYVEAGGQFGFTLTAYGDIGTTERFSFYFLGGSNNYFTGTGQMYWITQTDTGVPFTSAGLQVAFTLTGAQAYSVDITPAGGSTTTLNGSFLVAATNFDHIELFNFNAGSSSANDGFFNSVQVIPEPGTTALVLSGLAGLLAFRRRRA